VKTQLKIVRKNDGTTGLIKPKDVKKFENEIRKHLSIAFPPDLRPLKGYYEFTLNHYTLYKRDDNGMLIPEHYAQFDLDNLLKAVQDCFQPLKKKLTKYDESGEAKKTKKGNTSYELVEIEPGIISDDKFVYRGSANWVPVNEKSEEGIEIYIRLLEESELFSPNTPPGETTTFNYKI
jgi:Holliday junction resolvase RusA-like endonuclease